MNFFICFHGSSTLLPPFSKHLRLGTGLCPLLRFSHAVLHGDKSCLIWGFHQWGTLWWTATFCHGKSPFFMGKSTISMAIFHCYVRFTRGYPRAGWFLMGKSTGKTQDWKNDILDDNWGPSPILRETPICETDFCWKMWVLSRTGNNILTYLNNS